MVPITNSEVQDSNLLHGCAQQTLSILTFVVSEFCVSESWSTWWSHRCTPCSILSDRLTRFATLTVNNDSPNSHLKKAIPVRTALHGMAKLSCQSVLGFLICLSLTCCLISAELVFAGSTKEDSHRRTEASRMSGEWRQIFDLHRLRQYLEAGLSKAGWTLAILLPLVPCTWYIQRRLRASGAKSLLKNGPADTIGIGTFCYSFVLLLRAHTLCRCACRRSWPAQEACQLLQPFCTRNRFYILFNQNFS